MRISDWSSDVCSSDMVVMALVLTAFIILVTEFASNVASASGFMPVVAGLMIATGADPPLLAMPTAIAASWASCCRRAPPPTPDRKSVLSGKSVSVRVDLGGRRILKQQKNTQRI